MKLHCKVDRNMRHVPERISVLDLWEKLCHCLWIHQIRPLNLNLTQLDYPCNLLWRSRSVRSNCQRLQCCNWGHFDKVDQLNYWQLITIYTKKVGVGQWAALRNKGLIQRIQKVTSVGCNWFISIHVVYFVSWSWIVSDNQLSWNVLLFSCYQNGQLCLLSFHLRLNS